MKRNQPGRTLLSDILQSDTNDTVVFSEHATGRCPVVPVCIALLFIVIIYTYMAPGKSLLMAAVANVQLHSLLACNQLINSR